MSRVRVPEGVRKNSCLLYTSHIAAITGGEAVITTQSDNAGLWALDTLAEKYDWKRTVPHAEMNLSLIHI